MLPSTRAVHQRTKPNINITAKLTSRAETGKRLNIGIHQHYARDFHFVWSIAGENKNTTLERYFVKKEDYEKLCTELVRSPIEGVCGCLYDISANLPQLHYERTNSV
jgi:hypothetical protein